MAYMPALWHLDGLGVVLGVRVADSFTRALNDAAVRNAKPGSKAFKLADGGGLFLLVQPNGAKLWRYKFRLNGTEGLEALGAYPEVTLADAREAHRASRALVAAGKNPTRLKHEARQQAERERLEAQLGGWEQVVKGWRDRTDPDRAPATIEQREREIAKHLTPRFRGRLVGSIRRMELAQLLAEVEARAPEVAKNLRGYLDGIFEHAFDRGLCDSNPVPPRRTLKRRRQTPRAAMAVDQLGKFLRDLAACSAEPATKAAMMLVVMTACRKAEVTGAKWDEFDLDAASWTIPATRMKARRAHWVPLPRQAVAILRELRRQTNGEMAFPHRTRIGEPMAERTLNMLLKRLGAGGATVHGFRSVFSTRFNALGANPDVVERCLAHAPRDQVRAAYNRHDYADERRAMLQEWADWLDNLASQSGIVLQLAA